MPERVKAMMARMGGHPYENFDMIPYQILDPTKPLEENVDRMGMDYNWLPPELDPQGFPEFLVQAHNPIAQFEHQVRAVRVTDSAVRVTDSAVRVTDSAMHACSSRVCG